MPRNVASHLPLRRFLVRLYVFAVTGLALCAAHGQAIPPGTRGSSQGITGVVVDANLHPLLSPGTITIRRLSPTGQAPSTPVNVVTFGRPQPKHDDRERGFKRPYADGSYRIDDLAPGDYSVSMRIPRGYEVFFSLGSSPVAFTAFPFAPYPHGRRKAEDLFVHLSPGAYVSVNWKLIGPPPSPQ